MKIEILLLCILYCIGICAAKIMPAADVGLIFVFLLFVLLLKMLLSRSKRLRAALLVLFFAFGFARTVYLNNPANFVPAEYDRKTVYLEGVVQEVSEGDGYCTYTVQAERIWIEIKGESPRYAPIRSKVAVTAYERFAELPPYAYGNRIVVRGELRLPEAADNTGEFDFGLWYKTDGVYARIRTEETNVKYVGNAEMNPIYSAAHAVRTYVTGCIDNLIGGDAGAFLNGILLSDRDGMSKELQAAIRKAGLSHICVASGMHVAVLCGLLLRLFSVLRIKRWFYYPICILMLHFFALVVGGGPSIQRAVLMFDLCVLAYFLRGFEDRLYTCMCAGFIMLLLHPLYLFSVGFLLSFSCIFGIILFSGRVMQFLSRFIPWRSICSTMAMSISAQVLCLPILAWSFHTFSIYGILYNVLVTWLILPLMLMGGFLVLLSMVWLWGAGCFAWVLRLILQGLCIVVSSVHYLPLSSFAIASPNVLVCVAFYAAVLCICAVVVKHKLYAKVCACILCVCLILSTVGSMVSDRYAKVHFINVGEGDCTLFRLPCGINALVDGGGTNFGDAYNVGEKTVLPYLQRLGINTLDYAIVSHYDTDHTQGIQYLCEYMEVRNLILPERHPQFNSKNKTRLECIAEERGIHVRYVRAEDVLKLPGGLEIDVLSPDAQMLKYRMPENNLSLVMRIAYGDFRMLFTGDIEMSTEQKMVATNRDLHAQLLKVAHHGSDTSSSPTFVGEVAPLYAVISAGSYAQYGHPSARTVLTLKQAGAEIYSTTTAGDVVFYINRRGKAWIL